MNKAGLILVLSGAALLGAVFGYDAGLDVAVARWFFDLHLDSAYPGLLPVLRQLGKLVVIALVGTAAVGLILKLLAPRLRWWMTTRMMAFLLMSFLLGPGLAVNAVLKEQWGRSRPVDIVELGGSDRMMPWWNPRGDCAHNCSFVSGDAAAAFWTMAAAAVTPPPWRALAYCGAIAFGGAATLHRMAIGAHFLTDSLFAGVLMYLLIWLLHGLMIRWPRTRLSEAEADRAMAQISGGWRGLFRDLMRRPRTEP